MEVIQVEFMSLLIFMEYLMRHVCNTMLETQIMFVIQLMSVETVTIRPAGLLKTTNDTLLKNTDTLKELKI